MSLCKHVLKVARRTIQGGIPNERYPAEYLTNWRLQYVHPTDAILQLKGFTLAVKDAHFYDAFKGEEKAEGKCINQAGVNFNPSKNTGAGRTFVQEDLDRCFEINHYYFLYEFGEIDETYITFHIYWVPIETVRRWYAEHGSKGKITRKRIQAFLNQAVFEQTLEIRD